MRVLVLGAYGLIGSYAVARLLQAGHEIIGLTRSPAEARRFPEVTWHEGDLGRLTAPEQWSVLLSGVDAVVNCAGALQASPRDDLYAVHVAAPDALLKACAARGIRRIVHISAAGIHGAETTFARTKRETEALLLASDLDWIVLRPALVLAPAAYGGTALLRGLAGFPLFVPIAGADVVVQVVSVGDVAETITRCIAPETPGRFIFELAHPAKTTLIDIVLGYRRWLGFVPRRVVRVPKALVRLGSILADAACYLGWRSPLRTTALLQIEQGVRANPDPWMAAFSIQPKSLSQIFAANPSIVQERWFARLYFVKPLGLVLLAIFWIISGLIALGPGYSRAIAILGDGTSLAPPVAVAATVTLDMLLGLAVLVRRTAKSALGGMILVGGMYIVAGTVLRPELWVDPLGAFAKIFPTTLAAAALLAIMDER